MTAAISRAGPSEARVLRSGEGTRIDRGARSGSLPRWPRRECSSDLIRRTCKLVFVHFEGAHLRERARQGGFIDWWVVIVQPSVQRSESRCQEMRTAFEAQFGQPVVLMAQDGRGVPTYWGRPDLVDYMAALPLDAIRWQRFTLRAA